MILEMFLVFIYKSRTFLPSLLDFLAILCYNNSVFKEGGTHGK